jgi:cephalosporin hydroxylase
MKSRLLPVSLVLIAILLASLALHVRLYRDTEALRREMRDPDSLTARRLMAAANTVWAESDHVYKSRWFGINTLQNPMDVWVTQEIMNEVKPDFIVEAGTYRGGSAILWASILMHINPEGRIITIDINNLTTKPARNHPLWEKVTFILGGSTDPETVEQVTRMVEGKRVLVILDSLHTAEHVLDELRAYAPLVPEGSYIVVQDTAGFMDPRPSGWPWEACETFVAESGGEWIIDKSRERFMISSNIDGFLKRVEGGPIVAPPPAVPGDDEHDEATGESESSGADSRSSDDESAVAAQAEPPPSGDDEAPSPDRQ